MLVHIFDHNDGAVDHGTDGNRNTTEGHNIGVNPLQAHNDKGSQNSHGQANNCHQGRAQMKQKHKAHCGNNQKLFQQLVPKIFNRSVN